MTKVLVIVLCALLVGCTVNTGTGSSYSVKPQVWQKRQPKYFGEVTPMLKLGNHLLVEFIYGPGRLLEPYEESCEQKLTNSMTMVTYSDKDYLIDLSKLVIRTEGKTYRLQQFSTYKMEGMHDVTKNTFRTVAVLEKDFEYIRENINKERIETRRLIPKSISSETILSFDGKFSCGENYYEMDLWFIDKASGGPERYTVYFFPWTYSYALH